MVPEVDRVLAGVRGLGLEIACAARGPSRWLLVAEGELIERAVVIEASGALLVAAWVRFHLPLSRSTAERGFLEGPPLSVLVARDPESPRHIRYAKTPSSRSFVAEVRVRAWPGSTPAPEVVDTVARWLAP